MHIAIVGCGQLARMLALAGWPLGIRFSFLADPGESTECVEGLGTIVVKPDAPDPARLYEALGKPDVITIEKESVDCGLLQHLQRFCAVHPSPAAIHECQNRRRQKALLDKLQIPNTPYRLAWDVESLRTAVAQMGIPCVIKSAEQGYDGKNQWRIETVTDLENFLQRKRNGDWIVERKIPFQREISILAVRDSGGECRFYPAAENHHVDGCLYTTLAPALDIPEPWLTHLHAALSRLLNHWQYVGLLAMECFVTEDGILVNELAPRVHNSGHWTQHADTTSQFENHLRAIAQWPLGDTGTAVHTAMLNLLGVAPEQKAVLGPAASLHWYNKAVRQGRKVGHINLRDRERQKLQEALKNLEHRIYSGNTSPQ